MAQNKLTKADFTTDQDVRWCPGCGDYAVLASIQKMLPTLDIPKENFVFVSGIGCAGRLPYYLDTYGFHTIHGRAPAVATGLKMSRPELSVWIITGDGDGLSIGANHLIHLCRRNVDVVVLLFNNQIYGLTKGQYSPTSELGKISKTTPYGSADHPLNPLRLALAAGATFVARALDVDANNLQSTLLAAAQHKGTSIVEIYQNCNIFNDKVYAAFTERDVRDERTIQLLDAQPMIYGANQDKGLSFENGRLKCLTVNADSKKQILTHQVNDADSLHADLLTTINHPDYPVPFGIFRAVNKPSYNELLQQRSFTSQEKNKKIQLDELLKGQHHWAI